MTSAGTQTSQYVITARGQKGDVRQTRARAASAVVLARTWIAAGYESVQIIDPLGHVLSPDRYRIKIMNGGRFFC
ncbi:MULTISPECIES: hypothetical protein [unclassified Methylobacterium]|jgi:hypothetical protein|uniref:hypothetical protein n=1 Tax=unclassified Methylobacterium TaxID=2615210 RepID=UPI001353FB56|nr:hypothetical protein [Methylobacterium sp. 2A]MWV25933.1 hypothetical protein [Methylobacterium sp. 2A]